MSSPTLATALLIVLLADQAQAGTWREVEGWVVAGCPKSGGQCSQYGGIPSATYADCNAALTAALRASTPQTAFSCKFVKRQQFFQ